MSTFKKVFFFFILPIIGVLFYEPATLASVFSLLWVVLLVFFLLGFLLWQGYAKALTFMIFLSGMNVIIRLMMLLSTAFSEAGVFNPSFTIFGLLGAAISFYLVLRLDKVDIRQHMIR
ncbi:MAG: hypothetical protein HPY72_08115 [Anaerolineae bacterium]|jgi:hypothetical protein|nr:hypothetical protein [Anaerolineae bacterium]